jgi:hypothetical protein
MQVYTDRLVTEDGQLLPMSSEVVAEVDTTGNVTATRGRNLGNKAFGTALLGPIGLFGIGNAKTTVQDTRETFLMIEGPDWQLSLKYGPDLGIFVRAFAQAVNLAARVIAPAASPGSAATSQDDPLDRIKKLGELRDSGFLTEDEFEEQKRKLLASI